MSIFDHHDYKSYLKYIVERRKGERGYQTRLSKAAGCQPSYLSQVLNGMQHLSPDNIAEIGNHLDLNDDETEYLLNLLLIEKSGSRRLKNFYGRKNQKLQQKNNTVGKRLKLKTTILKEKFRSLYYSRKIYSALHQLLTIPKYQTIEAVSNRIGIKRKQLEPILTDLGEMGLVEQKDGAWKTTVLNMHTADYYRLQHYSNWGLNAIAALHSGNEQGAWYIDVISLSRRDYNELKRQLTTWIQVFRETVKKSKEEELYHLQIAFYEV